MELAGKVVVVTGGGSGIGRALCERFARESVAGLLVADRNPDSAASVASATGGEWAGCDVADPAASETLVRQAVERWGRIDLFCANAGIAVTGGLETSDPDWERIWKINTMAHVYAARAAVPQMRAQGGGYILATVSAAGLLSDITSVSYSVTKHAALAFAEWLAIAHAAEGIRVSAVCPQWVNTPLIEEIGGSVREWMNESAIEPAAVAEAVVAGLREERFLILPHPEVEDYFRKKAAGYDRWLKGMGKLRAKVMPPEH